LVLDPGYFYGSEKSNNIKIPGWIDGYINISIYPILPAFDKSFKMG
jgi:hypothetical protein